MVLVFLSCSAASPRLLLRRDLGRQGVTQSRRSRKELYMTCSGACATPEAADVEVEVESEDGGDEMVEG